VGEVADTGVHGANRLASNGVTEGLVAGRRVGSALGDRLPGGGEPVIPAGEARWVSPAGRHDLAAAMSRWAGPLRDREGLTAVAGLLDAALVTPGAFDLAHVEATNLHTVSWLIVEGALMRRESRGCHRRLDAPQPNPSWQGRIEQRLGERLSLTFVPDEVAA
jgi:L-aspartate oxidase